MDSNLLKTKSIEALQARRRRAERDGLGAACRPSTSPCWASAPSSAPGSSCSPAPPPPTRRARPSRCPTSWPGLACGFAALCYAEFAAMIPIAGSAYAYAYATLGEIIAWMIGWDLILEYAVGSMTVAIGWSGYFQRILNGFGIYLPAWMCAAPGTMDGARHQPARGRDRAPHHGPARDRRAGERALQRGHGRDQGRRRPLLHRGGRQVRRARELAALLPLRLGRHDGGGGGGVLRLHRLRRGHHHRRGGQEPQARPAHRHHRVPRHLHHALHRGGRRSCPAWCPSPTTARTPTSCPELPS